MDTIRVARLYTDATLPTRKHPTDAGMDFYAYRDYCINSLDSAVIKTGVSVEVPEGYMLLLKPKGSSYYLVGAGVVDAYYEPGEVLIKIINYNDTYINIKRGDPVAQGILVPVETPDIEEITHHELAENISARSGRGSILSYA